MKAKVVLNKVCPHCGKKIRGGQSEAVIPYYNPAGEIVEEIRYHLDCSINFPVSLGKDGEVDLMKYPPAQNQ